MNGTQQCVDFYRSKTAMKPSSPVPRIQVDAIIVKSILEGPRRIHSSLSLCHSLRPVLLQCTYTYVIFIAHSFRKRPSHRFTGPPLEIFSHRARTECMVSKVTYVRKLNFVKFKTQTFKQHIRARSRRRPCREIISKRLQPFSRLGVIN